ncbi:relaxase/mobilization nuclease domain-containing protein [Niastella sp. OAS944]|uniref:relaxase/mobilization nuclease domain-containing protein n=1 Tax=Niastella sp. OAS944 TaxID=2664089 RepID=UPI00347E8B66|nr:hypothetical protein [Chitinophagaceae bacterium OAS944]
MVTIIGSGEVIRGAVSYNENKVKDGDAKLLAAVRYPKDLGQLSFKEKLNVLQRLADLRPSVDHRCVHISVNFDSSDNLSNEQLLEIAERYMEGIGFGYQPYLVYSHLDAAHPHLHIVSTPIKADGDLIRLHNLGKTTSSIVREKIERDFNLVRAKGRNSIDRAVIRPADLTKAQYGRRHTKAEISNVVRSVFHHFKYTSFGEFNAVLNAFNVTADPGQPGMRMHEYGGLLYFLLDPAGNKIGKGIKASAIFDEPTTKKLKERFVKNALKKDDYKGRVCRVIDDVLAKGGSETQLLNELDKYEISVVVRKNKDGRTYGITYVDRKTFHVFNASDLKKYPGAVLLSNLLRKNDDSNNSKNNQVITEALSSTKFDAGINSVMVQWLSKGLLLSAEPVEGEIPSYIMRHLASPITHDFLLPYKFARYLHVNGVSPERTKYLQDQLKNSSPDLILSILNDVHDITREKAISHLIKIVDDCFEVAESGRSVSSALLREAKKKSRRRRY